LQLLAQTSYPGLQGFLGTRGSLMLDVVFLAMFLVVPAMAVSIYLVRVRRRYVLHKQIQTTLATVLLVAVLAFELDMRFGSGWRERASPSPYWTEGFNLIWQALVIHLLFAVPTLFLWIAVIVQAYRKFPAPPLPGVHSASHRFWGWLAAIGMTMTAVTGWIFYWLAFVA
jgi:hypothetical protein